MRAEDRKPSKRVFPLLQNLDLDTVTFAEVQSVGDPISIQDMNEQEMLDLILVNLARLCVAGEWTGLLEAGGGGSNEFNGELTKYNWDGDADPIRVLALGPYGTTERVHNATDIQDGKLSWFPFISPYTGTVSEVDLYIGSTSGATGSVDVGFYSDDDGVPKTFMGEFVVDVHTSAGVVTQTTSSADVELTRGTQYWMGMYANNWESQANFTANEIQSSGSSALQTSPNGISGIHSAMVMTTSGNATVTDWTALSPSTSNPINVGVKF